MSLGHTPKTLPRCSKCAKGKGRSTRAEPGEWAELSTNTKDDTHPDFCNYEILSCAHSENERSLATRISKLQTETQQLTHDSLPNVSTVSPVLHSIQQKLGALADVVRQMEWNTQATTAVQNNPEISQTMMVASSPQMFGGSDANDGSNATGQPANLMNNTFVTQEDRDVVARQWSEVVIFLEHNDFVSGHGIPDAWLNYTSIAQRAKICLAAQVLVDTDGADNAVGGAGVPGEDAYAVFRALVLSIAMQVTEDYSNMEDMQNHMWDPGINAVVIPIPYHDPQHSANTSGKYRFVLDLCSGTCAASQFHLKRDNSVIVIAVDMYKSQEWTLKWIPAAYRGRFLYIKRDVATISLDFVKRVIQAYSRTSTFDDVIAIYYSPCCKTLSRASRNKPRYRDEDGNPVHPKSVQADRNMSTTIQNIVKMLLENNKIAVFIENPLSGVFPTRPPIVSLIKAGWVLKLTSYCKNVDPKEEGYFPQKHTLVVGNKIERNAEFPYCEFDCDHRISKHSKLHKVLLCNRDDMAPGQYVETDEMRKGIIPQALHRRLWESFERMRLSETITGDDVDCCAFCALICLNAASEKQDANMAVAKLIHARLGHPSEVRMKNSKEHWIGIPSFKMPTNFKCLCCDVAKATRTPHKRNEFETHYALQLVHTDLTGPFEVEGHGGFFYAQIFVDDNTRRKFPYFLRTKNQATTMLRRFVRDVGLPVCIRLDGGGEFEGAFEEGWIDTCIELGIKLQKTDPESPESNGVAERANRTLITIARTMMLAAAVPKELWPYAVQHAAFLDSLFVPIGKTQSPYFAWFHFKPDLSRLRVWGSRVTYVHTKYTQKLDMPAHQALYLGISPETGGYILLDLQGADAQVVTSNDVRLKTFDESLIFKEPVGQKESESYKICDIKEIKDLGEEPSPAYVAIDASLRPPPEKGKGAMWQAYQSFSSQIRTRLGTGTSLRLSPHETEALISKEWRIYGRAEAEARIRAKTDPLPTWQQFKDDVWDQKRETRSKKGPLRPRDGESHGIQDPTNVSLSGGALTGQATLPKSNVSGGKKKATKHAPSGGGYLSSIDAPPLPPMDANDIACRICKKRECSEVGPNTMWKCDKCDTGWHQSCLKMKTMPVDELWYCPDCRQPGLQVEIWERTTEKYHLATIDQKLDAGYYLIRFEHGEIDKINLEKRRWRPVEPSPETIVGLITSDMFLADMYGSEPKTTKAALAAPDAKDWIASMTKEVESLMSRRVFVFIEKIPPNAIILPTMFVYKVKATGEKKSRLVVLGNHQKETSIVGPRIDPVKRGNMAKHDRNAVTTQSSEGEKLLSEETLKEVYKTMAKNKAGETSFKESDTDFTSHSKHVSEFEEFNIAAPTPRMSTVKFVLIYGLQMSYMCRHFDVCSAFSCAPLDSKVPILVRMPPLGTQYSNRIAQLLMAAYGLRSSPRDWSQLFRNWLIAHGWKRSAFDPCLYTRKFGDHLALLVFWVDDCLVCCTEEICDIVIKEVDASKGGDFDITDLGEVTRFMGITIERTATEMLLGQEDLIRSLADKVGIKQTTGLKLPMGSKRPSSADCAYIFDSEGKKVHDPAMKAYPYRMIIGCLLWLNHTRFDIKFCTKELSRYNSNYGIKHWEAAKRAVDYLSRTRSHRMKFTKTGDFTARAYCDADYNGSADERLPTTAYIIFLGACPLDASSRCQKFSARSVGEAEFGSLSACVAEILFHRQLLNAKNLQQQAITILAPKEAEDVLRNAKEESSVEAIVYSDSTTAIANGNSPVGWLSDKLKHCQNHLFFVKQYISMGWVRLVHVPSALNPADALSKGFDDPERWSAFVKVLLGHVPPFGVQQAAKAA